MRRTSAWLLCLAVLGCAGSQPEPEPGCPHDPTGCFCGEAVLTYVRNLQSEVVRSWAPPEDAPTGATAVVTFTIADDGSITSPNASDVLSDPMLEESILTAMRTVRLPALPDAAACLSQKPIRAVFKVDRR